MPGDGSFSIDDHLLRFQSGEGTLDADAISDYIKANPECHDRVAEFFRLIDVPESEYLDETLDELTENIYNLCKALVKEGPAEKQQDHENIRFLEEPEAADHYIDEGDEIVADVQDYAGHDQVRGESMDNLLDEMKRSTAEFDLVLDLLQKGIDLKGRWSADCRNLKGILYLSEEQTEQAEVCFRDVIAMRGVDLYLRTVQVHAMNNLSYICCMNSKIDEAIKLAIRSRALAEETGIDTFSCRFGLMYFYMLRDQDGDIAHATEEISSMLGSDGKKEEFARCLKLPSNKEIRHLFENHGLDDQFSVLKD
ncbi:MAG: hypothetical protein ACI97A_002963 [Planctomycetota bacterium]|jgi:hypothetical protein